MNMTALSDLVGLADPLDPAQMRFTARPAKSCRGCVFDGQRASVCRQASSLAVLAELPDCDQGVIYVALEIDPRQIEIV